MIAVVQGTNEFDDYNTFLRAMGVVLAGMNKEDPHLYVYALGSKSSKIPLFAMEFCNLSENGLKARGKKIKLYKANDEWIESYIDQINYFAFFSKPKQPLSSIAKKVKDNGIELGIFQY